MINALITIVSLALVIIMSEVFVNQIIALSKKLKISGFIIGFILVSLGTSIPELTTSIYSTTIGHSGVALANIIGSNIANILLVLGLLALLRKYKLQAIDSSFNIPLLLVITVGIILLIAANGFVVSPILGVIFLSIFFISAFLLNKNNGTHKTDLAPKLNLFYLFGAILLIIIFSKICVDSLLKLAIDLNIPEVFTGYFLLALGTSLPEFATLYASLKKGREDIGLGTIIGSNMFNMLFILGTVSFISKLDLSGFKVELFFILFATILLFIAGIMGKKYFLSKKEGFVLLFSYILFVLVQILGLG